MTRTRTTPRPRPALLAAAALLAAGCVGKNNEDPASGKSETAETSKPADEAGEGSDGAEAEESPGAPEVAPTGEAEPAKSSRARGASGRADRGAEPRRQPPTRRRPGQLTAGAWSDLEHWGFWRGLFTEQNAHGEAWSGYARAWQLDTGRRIPVEVTAFGEPAVDVEVTLAGAQGEVLWRARTDNRGRAELWAGLFGEEVAGPLTVRAEARGAAARQSLEESPSSAERLTLALSRPIEAPRGVDVMFAVDTTGSMGDELSYLKAELRNVIGRVQDQSDQELSIRTSVNFYRDQRDAYVVRSFPFSSDLGQVLSHLQAQRAGGGGDFPEAVDAALADAIREHQWRSEARARLLFLVLDAPPHQEPQVIERLHATLAEAARQGVRIVPVTGSGVDKSTEFFLRAAAAASGGTYLFLTDDSGIGNSHIEPTIGPHEVKPLNDLLVEVIRRYTA